MKGDKNKPQSTFMRWIDHFWDGAKRTTKKGKIRVPSQHVLKKYERKWKRREGKKGLRNEIDG